jgi:hypothetical protein
MEFLRHALAKGERPNLKLRPKSREYHHGLYFAPQRVSWTSGKQATTVNGFGACSAAINSCRKGKIAKYPAHGIRNLAKSIGNLAISK